MHRHLDGVALQNHEGVIDPDYTVGFQCWVGAGGTFSMDQFGITVGGITDDGRFAITSGSFNGDDILMINLLVRK